jgi:surface polysaccharide O-acyltransferase-like enzyme
MNNRNVALDLLKFFLILGVFIGHIMPYKFDIEWQTYISVILHSLARTVVPLFFIISGYFLKKKLDDADAIFAYVKRYFVMFIIWQLIFAYPMYTFYINQLVDNTTTIQTVLYGFGHLWFLNALFLGVILVYYTRQLHVNLKLNLAITLLFIGIILQNIPLPEEFRSIYNWIGTSRNFLFFGFPYLMIGTILNQINFKHSKQIIIFFGLLVIFEGFYYHNHNGISNLYIFSLPFTIALMKYITSYKKQIEVPFTINPNLLLGMYLVHFYPVYYLTLNFPENTFGVVLLKLLFVIITSYIIFRILDLINKKIKILF